jgi:transposase
MENLEKLTLIEMEEFVKSQRNVKIGAINGNAYVLIERVLRAQSYKRLKKSAKGTVRRFLAKVTGFSRAQVTRLISRWQQTRRVERKPVQRPTFPRRYSAEDAARLAAVDAAHEELSGPAVRHILQREFEVFGDPAYERLASISPSHIYNLRRSAAYRKVRVRVEHTQARKVSIAERRRPDPKGQPGYLRVDTVHQGHHDGKPGLYHINAVDTVTQWQIVGCVETISERHLKPVLEAMLHQFPFQIRGFHCDNGSEFLNRTVAALLNKLLVEFTKSRAYRSTDNALVEGKNGAVIRKQIGYGPIAAEHAEEFQKFYMVHLNPYLNFHRPCGFATIRTDARGRQKRVYPTQDYRTPYEKLCSLDNWQQHLKEGISPGQMDRQARRLSDTQAARQMQKAKLALLGRCRTKRATN